MKVKLKEEVKEQEVIEETNELPEDDAIVEEEAAEEDDSQDVKLENARLKGQLEVLTAKPKPTQDNLAERQRIQVLNDSNNLSDEEFEKIYKAPKHQVMATLLDNQIRANQMKTDQRIAESEAKSELTMKYGKDVSKYRKELAEALEDASPAVRQDPERLAAYLERQYLALSKQEEIRTPKKVVVKKEEDVQRRKITQDFAKPGIEGADLKKEDETKKDVIKEEYRSLGSRWGIETESERKEYLGKVVHVPMNFGNGITLTKRGFEKVVPNSDKK